MGSELGPQPPWAAGRAAWSIPNPGGLQDAFDVLDLYDHANGRVEAIVRVIFVMPEPTPRGVEAFEEAAERAGIRLKRVR